MYAIDSINPEFCQNTKKKVLKKLKKRQCKMCKNIPLPPYKYKEFEKDYFCYSCFDKVKLDVSLKIHPSIDEIELINNLIIKCPIDDCLSYFSTTNCNLKDYELHVNECNTIKTEDLDSTDLKHTFDPANKCCFCKEVADPYHNCLSGPKYNLKDSLGSK